MCPPVAQAEELATALAEPFGAGTVALLHADQSAADRWRNYLGVVRGQATIVVGTRSAVLAPLSHLGVILVWDESSNLHDEPRAPYPNTRDVAALRAQTDHCALLLAGHSCSPRVAGWLSAGWLAGVQTPREQLRALCARVRAPGDSDIALQRDPLANRVRLPDLVMQTISSGLISGPVLVSVPRPGNLVRPCCAACRRPISCPRCHGPVKGRRLAGGSTELECSWCGHLIEGWSCANCGGTVVRSGVVGASTTAAELGRAFPSVLVVDSSADHIRTTVGDEPALVVATPGAEPRAPSGYAAAILLDAGQALARPGLDAVCQVLDHWFRVAALVRSGVEGGQLVIVGPPEDRAVQAVIRNDPVAWAGVEMAERAEAGFPPAAFAALIDGSAAAVGGADERLRGDLTDAGLEVGMAPGQVSVLGPVESGPVETGGPRASASQARLMIRADLGLSAQLVPMLRHLRSAHSLRGEGGPLRVRINPVGQL
ncbi:MAG: primosomal protein N' [Acidipropionibacterium sp.]|nr:primosomal protein N' [Acidipropionibacterium sp.]